MANIAALEFIPGDASGSFLSFLIHDRQKLSIFSAARFDHGSSNISADTSWHLEIDLRNFFN